MDWLSFHVAFILSAIVHGVLLDVLGVERINMIIWGTMVVALIPAFIWFWAIPKLEAMEAQAEKVKVAPVAGD